RDRHPGAAGGDHHPDGRLSQAGVRRDHARGRQADHGQQGGAGKPCAEAGPERSGTVNLQADLLVLAPELILALGAMALLLLGAKCGERSAQLVSRCSIAVLLAAGAALVWSVPEHTAAFGGVFVADDFARFAKLLILAGSALSILLAEEFFTDINLSRF